MNGPAPATGGPGAGGPGPHDPRPGGAGRVRREAPRLVGVICHPWRDSAVQASAQLRHALVECGVQAVRITDTVGPEVDLVVVMGGDGTILRAAELVRGTPVPLLGVNLGHVGFLAEAEREEIADVVQRISTGDYAVEERMTLDVAVYTGGELRHRTWAVNEASVEKCARERMIEVVLEVDGRPVTEFGCDGVVMATPTGSTAYAFSAGGPVVWPEVEAVLVVPISAHALFARPLVLAPTAVTAVELLPPAPAAHEDAACGVLWCDGRRTVDLPPGARVEVRRSELPVRLARLARPPFADRLVAKFQLPVHGWRGRSRRG